MIGFNRKLSLAVIIFLTSGGDLREFMLTASDMGITNGEFAFLTIELFQSEAWGDFSWKRGKEIRAGN